jgi:hypothetical protein
MCKHISEVKELDDCNVPFSEYKRRNIKKKTLIPTVPVPTVSVPTVPIEVDETVSGFRVHEAFLDDIAEKFNDMRVESRNRFDNLDKYVKSLENKIQSLSIHLGNK